MKAIVIRLILILLVVMSCASATFAASMTAPTWTPSNNATNVLETAVITANYAYNIKDSTVTPARFFARYFSTGTPSCTVSSGFTAVGGSTSITHTGTTSTALNFTPTASLVSGGKYIACITTGITDNSSNTSTASSSTFTVRDYLPPTVTAYTPTAAIISNKSTGISITFSEAMTSGSITTSTILLDDITSSPAVSIAISGLSYNSSTKIASFTPSAPLTDFHTYRVTILGGASGVQDNNSNVMASNFTFSFTIDATNPTVTSYTPSTVYVNTSTPAISAIFAEHIDSATLTTSSFTLKKGTTTVTGTTPSFNTVTNLATLSTGALSDGQYTATLTTAIKDLASPPNAMLANVAWSFIVDTVAPTVAYTPANGSSNLPLSTVITATFTEANSMLVSSINSTNFYVNDGTSNIAGTISYNATTKTATFSPVSLGYGTTYTVTLTGVSDIAGNILPDTTWNFITTTASQATYDIVPPFVATYAKPNILIILDNSNSMDEDMNGLAIGSPFCSNYSDPNTCSRSIIARKALIDIVNSYANQMRIGIMTYKQSSSSKSTLGPSLYFTSYDKKSYCPNPPPECNSYCVNEDPKTGTYTMSGAESICQTSCAAQNALFKANYRDPIITTNGTGTNLGSAIGSTKRQAYCATIYPKTNSYTNTNGVTMYYKAPGTYYGISTGVSEYSYSAAYDSRDTNKPCGGVINSYDVYSTKTGTSDANSGYSNRTGGGGFCPTDEDYALGFYNFGQRMYDYYTTRTWFSNTSPGGGWLHTRINDNDPTSSPANVQLNALLAKLGGNNASPAFQNDETGYMSCTNTSDPNSCSYIVNAGLTPTAGTLQTALNYYNNSLTQAGIAIPTPIQNSCQKNFIIYVTDGLPSVSEAGTADTSANLMPTVLNKIDRLRCPSSPTASNCQVTKTISGTVYNYDTRTYVLGMGLGDDAKGYLDSMAVHGGTDKTGSAYYANNATELNNALIDIFQNILSGLASGTAASILNNSEGSGANLLQAVFYPKKQFDSNTEVSWVGEMQNLWYYLDPALQRTSIREDTDQNNVLDLRSDKIAQFYFDQATSTTKVQIFSDSNGDGSPDSTVPDNTVKPEAVKSLWKAGRLLWERNVSSTSGKRTIYTSYLSTQGSTPQKFSYDDADGFVTDTTAWSLLQIPAGTAAQRKAKAVTLIKWVHGMDQPTDTDGTTYRSRMVTNLTCGLTDTQGCTREWKLGDIISSTPKLVSSIKLNNYDLPSPDGYYDSTYTSFINSSAYKNRGMVFVGSNDGMLHAFKLGVLKELQGKYIKAQFNNTSGALATASDNLGREEWAFIPKQVLPYLKYLTDTAYSHIYSVDGSTRIVDASIGVPVSCLTDSSSCTKSSSTWRTVLIGGMGIGGAAKPSTDACSAPTDCVKVPITGAIGLSTYFALDVTDPENPTYMWEFKGDPSSPGSLGYSTSGPAIVRISKKDVSGNPDHSKNGKWFAVFASGPSGPIDTTNHQFLGQSDQTLKIFIVDLATGQLAKTIDTGIANAFAGSLANSVIDTDRYNNLSKGYYSDDAVYIGFTELDTTVTPNTWTKGGVIRLLTKESDDPGSSDTSKQWAWSYVIKSDPSDPTKKIGPVTSSIVKLQDRANNSLWIYFGTGRYYYKQDDPSTTTKQVLYGVKEPCYSTANRTMQTVVAGGTYNSIDYSCTDQVNNAPVDQSGTASSAPASSLAADASGWLITLDAAASGSMSERVITDPVALGSGAVFFTTFKPSSDVCKYGGDSLIWAVNYKTGGIPPGVSMKGKALMQVSTGAFAEISLSSAFANPGNARLDGRRLSTPVSGVPPTSQGLSVITNPPPVKKFLHVREK